MIWWIIYSGHHSCGYHGFFSASKILQFNNKLLAIIPKQIHKEFFGCVYICFTNCMQYPKFPIIHNIEWSRHSPLAHDFDVGCYKLTMKSRMVLHHFHQTHAFSYCSITWFLYLDSSVKWNNTKVSSIT